MFLDYYDVYRVSAREGMWRRVVCEKCGCVYYFRAIASASARFMRHAGPVAECFHAFQDQYRDAQDTAYRRVYAKLFSAAAKCPDCGWYQKSMLRTLKRKQGHWTLYAAAGAAGLAGFVGLAAGTGVGVPAGYRWAVSMAALALLGLAPLFLLLKLWIMWRYDPNADYKCRRKPPLDEVPTYREAEYQRVRLAQKFVEYSANWPAGTGWFYRINDQETGPMLHTDIADLLAAGTLGTEDLIWTEGFAEWVPISGVIRRLEKTGLELVGE